MALDFGATGFGVGDPAREAPRVGLKRRISAGQRRM